MSVNVKIARQNTIRASVDWVRIENTDVKPYTGTYTVTPCVDEAVVLNTADKLMKDDVTVEKIPQFEVENEQGGKTLIIGDEYYNGY